MIQTVIRRLLGSFGYELCRRDIGLSPVELDIVKKVQNYTMTSVGRLAGLLDAVSYVLDNKIAGDYVECGVWRGGSTMAAAYAFLAAGDSSRHLHLFDTFDGMTPPSEKDVAFSGETADALLKSTRRREGPGVWAFAGLEDVRHNMALTGYPQARIHFAQGRVENTVPAHAPEKIAILRLDTDWYDSTLHELVHLYPRLVPNGVLIIDDYGHWQGARKAVDKFLTELPFRPFLNRLDYTGRLLIKPSV